MDLFVDFRNEMKLEILSKQIYKNRSDSYICSEHYT